MMLLALPQPGAAAASACVGGRGLQLEHGPSVRPSMPDPPTRSTSRRVSPKFAIAEVFAWLSGNDEHDALLCAE